MPPRRERDEVLSELSQRIFSSMLDEIILDVVLKSHQEVARANAICPKCHTRCCSGHASGSASGSRPPAPVASSSRQSPKDEEAGYQNGSYETGRSTPNSGKLDGTVYFECEVCKRQIASNRYAPHLSSCLGLGNRRGAARNAATKNKLASEAGRSSSPYVPSENGYISDEAKPKGKGKSKAKRTDEAEFSIGKKRPSPGSGSPSGSPTKKPKTVKSKATSSPSRKVKTEPGTPNNPALAHATSLSKVPSKLRESSIISSALHGDRLSSPESRFSSPGRSAATPTSTLSAQSPLLSTLSGGAPRTKSRPPPKNGKPKTNGAVPKRPSPPRPPPPPPVARLPEPDYLVDVEGDETGSSTDDSS